VKEQKVIIRKVIKKVEAGSHGGSWKVAYADFITAMMAFFLLLWLITMVAPEKRARVASYFKNFTVFEHSGSSVLEKSNQVMNEMSSSDQKVTSELYGASKPEHFRDIIRKTADEKLGDVRDQIIVDTVEGGVRIQLVDRDGKPMFDAGSARPTPLAMRVLQVVGDAIGSLPNAVALEGHTDSLGFKSSSSGNWDLSTQRALVARRELERFGVSEDRFTRVAGYSDTLPLIREDPSDPRNRRISIILLFPQKSAATLP
jgi:chemotaxis protein MotB